MKKLKIDELKPPSRKILSSAALRALREAEDRRALNDEYSSGVGSIEVNGPKGLDPARYGDWEKNGIARDF